ncbi:MAG: hypothetical protein KGQ66_23280 [Acidobacteriota bacterium]|nr:hypothetical protein [Acidobacteriota bacterium]
MSTAQALRDPLASARAATDPNATDRSGLLMLDDDVDEPASRTCARNRLEEAFALLRRYAITAERVEGGDPDRIAESLAARRRSLFPDADGACVFVTAADFARSFDADGRLVAPLALHVRGDGVADAARAALRRVGLSVTA